MAESRILDGIRIRVYGNRSGGRKRLVFSLERDEALDESAWLNELRRRVGLDPAEQDDSAAVTALNDELRKQTGLPFSWDRTFEGFKFGAKIFTPVTCVDYNESPLSAVETLRRLEGLGAVVRDTQRDEDAERQLKTLLAGFNDVRGAFFIMEEGGERKLIVQVSLDAVREGIAQDLEAITGTIASGARSSSQLDPFATLTESDVARLGQQPVRLEYLLSGTTPELLKQRLGMLGLEEGKSLGQAGASRA
jgi:hypothetical protein